MLLVILGFIIHEIFRGPKIRDEKRKENISSIQKALSAYRTYNYSYPEAGFLSLGGPWRSSDVVYMSKVPTDPRPVLGQPYCYNNFGNIYLLCAQMEGSAYRCPTSADDVRSCNTCMMPGRKGFYYNYCVYKSY